MSSARQCSRRQRERRPGRPDARGERPQALQPLEARAPGYLLSRSEQRHARGRLIEVVARTWMSSVLDEVAGLLLLGLAKDFGNPLLADHRAVLKRRDRLVDQRHDR